MKIIFIFLASIIFIGCNTVTESDNLITASGKIKKIEMSAWMYGTHTLNNSDGEPIYALKSSSISLTEYENKLVGLSGTEVEEYLKLGPAYLNVIEIRLKE